MRSKCGGRNNLSTSSLTQRLIFVLDYLHDASLTVGYQSAFVSLFDLPLLFWDIHVDVHVELKYLPNIMILIRL